MTLQAQTPTWAAFPEVRRVITQMSPGNAALPADWTIMLCGRRISDLFPTERMARAWLDRWLIFARDHAVAALAAGEPSRGKGCGPSTTPAR